MGSATHPTRRGARADNHPASTDRTRDPRLSGVPAPLHDQHEALKRGHPRHERLLATAEGRPAERAPATPQAGNLILDPAYPLDDEERKTIYILREGKARA